MTVPLYEFQGMRPQIGAGTFVHPEAVLIGDVLVGEHCHIAPGVVLRGDKGSIAIRDRCFFQDNCIGHGTLEIGPNAMIGHGCIVHSSRIGDSVMVGMGSIVGHGCEIGDDCTIGMGTLLLPNTEVPPRKMVVGSPGRIVRDVSAEDAQRQREKFQEGNSLPIQYHASFRRIDTDSD